MCTIHTTSCRNLLLAKYSFHVRVLQFSHRYTQQQSSFSGNTGGYAGAVVAFNSKLIVERCKFVNNTILAADGYDVNVVGGGAVAVAGTNATAVISDSLFKNNSAMFGGALQVRSAVSVQLKNNVFDSNSAATFGGNICSN
jgi:hypothetical protein